MLIIDAISGSGMNILCKIVTEIAITLTRFTTAITTNNNNNNNNNNNGSELSAALRASLILRRGVSLGCKRGDFFQV